MLKPQNLPEQFSLMGDNPPAQGLLSISELLPCVYISNQPATRNHTGSDSNAEQAEWNHRGGMYRTRRTDTMWRTAVCTQEPQAACTVNRGAARYGVGRTFSMSQDL